MIILAGIYGLTLPENRPGENKPQLQPLENCDGTAHLLDRPNKRKANFVATSVPRTES
jgi:hypothetical protein